MPQHTATKALGNKLLQVHHLTYELETQSSLSIFHRGIIWDICLSKTTTQLVFMEVEPGNVYIIDQSTMCLQVFTYYGNWDYWYSDARACGCPVSASQEAAL